MPALGRVGLLRAPLRFGPTDRPSGALRIPHARVRRLRLSGPPPMLVLKDVLGRVLRGFRSESFLPLGSSFWHRQSCHLRTLLVHLEESVNLKLRWRLSSTKACLHLFLGLHHVKRRYISKIDSILD